MNNSSDRPIGRKVTQVLTVALAFALTLGAGQMAWATTFRAPVNLGKATPFAILTKSGITNVPTSHITGHLGVSPIAATAITGFSLILDSTTKFSRSAQVTGKIYAASYASPTPADLTTAVHNMETAYTNAAGRTIPDFTELYAGNLSGRTLAPGLYKWSTGVLVTSAVTLAGPPNAVWIFQIAGNLTMGSGSKVLLSGGAQAGNIFWQVAGGVGVEIGTTAHVEGTILAKKAIHLRTGASLNGRAMAQTAVTLAKNIVKIPLYDGVTNPTLGAVTPSTLTSAPGVAKTFRAVYTDTDGYASLRNLHFLVNATLDGANGIWLMYVRPANKLYLYNNAGTGFVGTCTPGVAGRLSNSQGTLLCGATTVSGSGNNLTISWSIRPKAAFARPTKRNIYLFARDKYNATAGWTDKGNWTIRNPSSPDVAYDLDVDSSWQETSGDDEHETITR